MQAAHGATFDGIAFARKSYVKVMNIVCMVSASLALLSAYIGRDSVPYFFSLIGLASIFLFSLFYYLIFKFSLARYFVPIATTLWISYMCIAFGSGLGNQNYLVIALVAFAVFSKEGWYRVTGISAILAIALFVNIYQRYYLPLYDMPKAADFLFVINIITPMIIIVLMCWNLMKDVSKAQKIIEQQKQSLSDSNQFKDKLLSIIGHDMRSPFYSAKGLIQLMENDLLTKTERESLLKELHADVDMSLKTLDNILNWASQSYYGSVLNTKTKTEHLNIYEMVEMTISSFHHLAAQKGVVLRNLIAPATIAWGDREQIIFIIRNLTSNALKFSREGQGIDFDVVEDKGKLIFSVKDQGIGMNEQMLSSLFHIATRFSKEGTAKEKGSGLGLIFCKEFIEYNNGNLWIESKEGHGTTVYFSLLK
jgi:two-component system, sensor histidine kinase and response regulator